MMDDRHTQEPTPRSKDDDRSQSDVDPEERREGQGSEAHDQQESNPLFREGADAPDAADIEQPERQR